MPPAAVDQHAAAHKDQNSILAGKVSRALEVRSDTPAMKAALDALAHLPDHQDDLFSVDSRSVRVAIEKDALQQALLLQQQLQTLLNVVGQLRQGVSETAAIAQQVEEAIQMNVVTARVDPVPTTPAEESATDAPVDQALQQEQRLAAVLSDAFAQRNAARKRVETVHAFLEKFDLSEEDSRLLDHYAFEDVETTHVSGTAFLAALERVRLIRKELGQTFGTIDLLHNQKMLRQEKIGSDTNRLGASSALRMMEVLAQKQERAYERLYHWLQKYLNVHGHENAGAFGPIDEDHMDEALAHPFVRQSLYTLRNVPAFHTHLLELIASSRRSEETRRFLLALTSGYGGFPPIEMRAHDPVVYVGDMLAFCFRAFSVEADVAAGLLSYQPPSGEGVGEEKEEIPQAEEEDEYGIEKPITSGEMLSQSMGGVSRPLKARIVHVISSLSRRHDDDDESDDGMADGLEEEGAATRNRLSQLYEICGLLLFYNSAIGKTMAKLDSGESRNDNATANAENLTESNPLLASIMECLAEAANAFEASLRVYGAMLEQLHVLTGDSEASLAHAMIGRLVEVRKVSPGFAQDFDCPPAQQKLLAIDWACEALVEAALPSCKTLDDTVTLRQAIVVARQGDLTVEVANTLESKVHDRENALIDVLVEKETTDVLDLCGLGSLATSWERFNRVYVEGMVMATHPGLSPEDLQSAVAEFYSSLFSPPLPSFESTIKDPTLRKHARSKIANNICSVYESLYNDIARPDKGGYDNLSFLNHTPQQVNTLFTA